ncbi:MAG: sulfatase [Acidobacteriota bacterium]
MISRPRPALRSSPCRSRLARRHVALALLVLLAAGCAEPPPTPELAALDGDVLFDGDLMLLPNRAWRAAEDRSVWLFAGAGAFAARVREMPSTDLVLVLTLPADSSVQGDATLAATWNAEPLAVTPIEATADAPARLEIVVARDLLTPGLHTLSVAAVAPEPTADADSQGEGEGDSTFAAFSSITATWDGETQPIEKGLMLRYWYITDLLTLGVTGSGGDEKLGGFAFVGPRSVTVRLPSDQGGVFSARVLGSAQQPATFRAAGGREASGGVEVAVEPHRAAPLEIEMPIGTKTITLSAEGGDDGLYLWGAPRFRPALGSGGPPVVLITLDTTRRDVFSFYHDETDDVPSSHTQVSNHTLQPAPTPHLDALAATSTVYERAYTTSPWTLPSHASMFTGLYPTKHGAGVSTDILESEHRTLAERLGGAGYFTAGVAGGVLASFRFGVARGFDLFVSPRGFERPGHEVADLGLEVIERHGDAPFFLFLNFFDPHFPYVPPDVDREALGIAPDAAAALPPLWRRAAEGDGNAFQKIVDRAVEPSAEGEALLEALYRAEVASMDRQIGRVLDALRARDLFDRALIVVLADHGELFGEDGYFSHSNRLDTELIEIPMLVKLPDQTQGRRVDALASAVDVLPTVLEAAGLGLQRTHESQLDGLALQDEEAVAARRPHVVAEEHDAPLHRLFEQMKIADELWAVQTVDQRRLVWRGGDRCYTGAPGAWTETACDAELTARSDAVVEGLEREAHRPRVERIGLSGEEQAKLRALGYIR